MSSGSNATVSFGVQAGDKSADAAVSPHYLALRQLLARTCVGPYSELIREFRLVLRIDGSIWHWEKTGPEGARIQKKSGYATVDIYMPKSAWDGKDPSSIREFLATETANAVALIADRAYEAGVPLDRQHLASDIDAVMRAFRTA
jgi:hypothetical protein